MEKVILIARRELYSYFKTWMGYIIVFLSLLISGLLFNAFAIGNRAKFSAQVLYDFFFYSSGIAMVASLFLAMRLFAEEKQTGTLTLFLTAPISERQVIYGKFLSALTIFLLLQFLSLYLPALIFIEGKVSFGHIASGYLGISLLGFSVLAMALFASLVAPNQMIAGVIAAAMVMVLLTLWIVANRVDEPFRTILGYLAIHNQHFSSFARGVINLKDIVYYFSLIIFFLECSVRTLESRRF